MSYHYPEVASTAIHILIEADSEKLLAIAISVAPQVGDSLGQAIARFLKQQPRDFTQANRLLNLIPQSSVVLAQAAVLLTQQALRGLPADPSDFQKSNERARLLNKLSNRLSDVGSRSAALSAIKEAVRIRRALAEQAPEEFEPDLAKSLNNLSNCLSAMGSRSAALSAIKEAVRIRRALAERAPEEFEPDLAKSLNNLSNQLSDVGDSAAALDAIEEAVRMYRPLAVRSSDTFEPDLAMSLNNLSNRLSDVGDSAAALAAIEEAVKIYQRLAERSPAAILILKHLYCSQSV
uniref:Tetratricopeptide repeat protein n=1 Tax=Oscillatoriales cyanobacterium SpSt-418 TaxID=2282169 RepID=A0A7C3PFW5_9CYAN